MTYLPVTVLSSLDPSHSVFVGEEGVLLYMRLQGLEEEVYRLEHYEHDTLCWLRPWNELVSRGRWVLQGPEYFLFRFQAGGDSDAIGRFTWVNDPGVPKGCLREKLKID